MILFWQMRKQALRYQNPDVRQPVRDEFGTEPMIFFRKCHYFGVDISVVFAVKSTPFRAQMTVKKKKIKPLTDVKSKSP